MWKSDPIVMRPQRAQVVTPTLAVAYMVFELNAGNVDKPVY